MKKTIRYFQAVAVIVGFIIGVGMFGLPFLFSRAGILSFFMYVFVIGYIQYIINILYANVIAINKDNHRMPGYAEIYFGKKGKLVILIAKLIGNYGSMLAYTIITGIFLNTLLSPIFGDHTLLYVTIFYIMQSVVVLLGVSVIAEFELLMTVVLVFVIFMILYKGSDVMTLSHFSLIDIKQSFIPYGAVLFALGGHGAIPIVSNMLKRNPKRIKSAIKLGMFFSYSIIVIFTLTIIGISGSNTTTDALVGVGQYLDNKVIILALIFGVISMTTSFVGVAESLKEAFCWDYKMNKSLAWFLAVFFPYILYAAGVKDLITVMGFVGAIAGGVSSTLLFLIFLKIKDIKGPKIINIHINKFFIYLMIVMFLSGAAFEIYQNLN